MESAKVGKHLDRLGEYKDGHDGRVFAITKNEDGTFEITEGCDHYFSETFTTDELRELAEEIIEVSRT